MADGREDALWWQTAAVMQQAANMNRGKGKVPLKITKFHLPTQRRSAQLGRQIGHDLKAKRDG